MLRPRHPAYLLIALVTASVLWYASTGKRRATISVRSTKATLTLVNLPPDLVLTSAVPDTVTLQLRGPLTRTPTGAGTLEVFLDLAEAHVGRGTYPIDVSATRLPAEAEIISVDPAEVELELERVILRSLEVRPTIVGEPAAGFSYRAQATPPRITIQGPESRLASREDVTTSPVSVEGVTESFDATVTPLVTDPLLRVLTTSPVTVRVSVQPTNPDAPDAAPGTANGRTDIGRSP